jgi:transposase
LPVVDRSTIAADFDQMRPMSKSYRPWTPTQSYLLPPSPLEWLPKDHLAYFVLDLVSQLDLTAIEARIGDKDPRGERPYAPGMMVSLLLYGYAVGVYSSRRIARATYEDVAFRVLSGDTHPFFTTVNEFRLQHREALADLFVQVLRLCMRAGLVKLGLIALDGTKIRAAASKHRAMSYGRMLEEEARLKAEVEALLARADEVDEREDEERGVGRDAEDIPAELARRETRLAKIREAREALERDAAEARAEQLREQSRSLKETAVDASAPQKRRRLAATLAEVRLDQAQELDGRDDDEDPPAGVPTDMPSNRVPTDPSGKPKSTAQRNFTDPDSRIMMKNGAFEQAYNAQIVVDAEHQIILAHGVGNQSPDVEYFIPMVERLVEQLPINDSTTLLADSGYMSNGNAHYAETRGIDALISVGRDRHGTEQTQQARWADMRGKLAAPEARAAYKRRKVIAEPPFGQIKEARGFRHFSLRGLPKCSFEWAFVSLVHNALKLFRALRVMVPEPGGGSMRPDSTPSALAAT